MPTEVKKENLDIQRGEMPPPLCSQMLRKESKSLIEEENNPNLKLRVYVQVGMFRFPIRISRSMKLKMRTMRKWSV